MSGDGAQVPLEGLSEMAQGMADRIDLRRHSVNLERVQRIHLGIDCEPMGFNAESIAAMLQKVADSCDANEAFVIHAVARALLGLDQHHRLELKQQKPGQFKSPTKHEEHSAKLDSWLRQLAALEESGVKTESAVAEIAAEWSVSRAAVFAGIRETEASLEAAQKLFPKSDAFKNPRPTKKRNT